MTGVPEALTALAIRTVAPLAEALQDADDLEQLLRDVGWRARLPTSTVEALRAAAGLDDALEVAFQALQHWRALPEPGIDDLPAVAAAAAPLMAKLRALGSFGQAVTGPPFDHPDFWTEVSRDLPNLLLVRQVSSEAPFVHALLLLTGVVGYVDVPATDPPDPLRLSYRRAVVDWAALGAFARDPAGHLASRYGWGDTVQSDLLLRTLEQTLLAIGLPARREAIGGPVRSRYTSPPADARQLVVPVLEGSPVDGAPYVKVALILAAVPAPGADDAPRGLLVLPQLGSGIAADLPLGGPLHLETSASAMLEDGLELVLLPGSAQVSADAPDAAVDVLLRLAARPPTRRVLIGEPFSHRLEIGTVWLSLAAAGELVDGSVEDTEVVVELGTDPSGVAAVLQFGQADGFLGKVFGTEPQVLELGGVLRWSSRTGLRLDGNVGLTVTLPLDLGIGGVRLTQLLVGLQATSDGVRVVVAISGGLHLGPIAGGIDEVGVAVVVAPVPADAPAGNAGDLAVSFAFKPPTAVSLAIDAKPVKGGGYVLFDADREQYAGLLHLEVADTVAVTAIALLTTRLPDGSKGFSLLVLVSASGFTPIQLGMGFTLNGIGGLLGINRSVDLGVLRPGLRSGMLDAVLFPDDPARNASAIVGALSAVFPATRDHFVLGPMAILGWGTPTLVTLKLGVLIEAPSPTRLLLLGRLSVVLPEPKNAAVRIQLDALGVLDFDRGELSLDATLFDSQILKFALTGDMAMRLGWGVEPQFLVAIGGFNPRFPTPSGFPELKRLALELSASQNPRLRFEAYIALTSNTAQFGARAELFFKVAGFSIEGKLGFDALLQFSPFGFVVDISAGLVVRRDAAVLLAITAEVCLSGPSPWRARGSASFTLLVLSVSVNFDLEVGEPAEAELPQAFDVRGLLMAALADPRNWSSELPADAPPLVSFTDSAEAPAPVRVHPLARLSVRQRVVPLGRTITAFGTGVPAGERDFRVTVTDRDGDPWVVSGTALMDTFAPAQYDRLTDEQRLAAPAFVDMQAGLTFGADRIAWPAAAVRERTVEYEELVVDPLADARSPTQPVPRPVVRAIIPSRGDEPSTRPHRSRTAGHVPAGAVTGVVRNRMRTGIRP